MSGLATPLAEARCPRCRGTGNILFEPIYGNPHAGPPRTSRLSRAMWFARHTTGALVVVTCPDCAGGGTLLSFTCEPADAAAIVDALRTLAAT